MRRREFITLAGGAATWPLAARPQQGERMRRVGVLVPAAADDPVWQARLGAFLQGLALSSQVMKRSEKDRKQVREFRKAARELGCDESEDGFREMLRKIGKAKPKVPPPKRKAQRP